MKLTAGIGWRILGTVLLLYVGGIIVPIALYAAVEFVPRLNNLPFYVVISCLANVLLLPITIALFLFYERAAAAEQERTAASGHLE